MMPETRGAVWNTILCSIFSFIYFLWWAAVTCEFPFGINKVNQIKSNLALWRGVLFTDESRFSLYRADGRPVSWCHVGERFADVNVVDWVAHGGGGVMVWAGICYGQRTQVHFIDGILNTQRYRDEILRPIVVPFIMTITSCCSMIMHGPMLQGSIQNSWKLTIYIELLLCIVVHSKRFTMGGLSSTTTSVQHPLGWWDGCHRTTAPVRSPHTSYRWREERES